MIFFVNLPVGVAALVLLARVARSARRPVPFDWAGQVTAVLGLGGITYGLIEGGAAGFGTPPVVTAFAVGAAALAVFVLVEARVAHPVLPSGLFRSRAVAVPVAVGFWLNVGFYGMLFLLSLVLQQQRGLSASATGLAFVPMTALTAAGNLAGARAERRISPRAQAVTGQLLIAAGLAILCLAADGAPAWVVVVLVILVGVGGGSLAVPVGDRAAARRGPRRAGRNGQRGAECLAPAWRRDRGRGLRRASRRPGSLHPWPACQLAGRRADGARHYCRQPSAAGWPRPGRQRLTRRESRCWGALPVPGTTGSPSPSPRGV